MFKYISLFLPSLILAGNLNELIELTFNNELVEAKKVSIESSKFEKESLKKSYYPNLHINSSYSRFDEPNEMNPRSSASISAKLSMNLYDGGVKKNKLKYYENLILQSKSDLKDVKNQLALEVVKSYFSKLNLLATKRAKEQEIEQLKAEVDRVKKFFKVGIKAEDEVERLKAKLSQNRVELAEINLSLREIDLTLKYLTNRDIDIEIGSQFREPIEIEPKIRADVKSLELQTKSLNNLANIEKANYRPNINVENSYSFNDYSFKGEPMIEMQERQNHFLLTLNWKVFDFDSSKNSYEAKKRNYEVSMQNFLSQKRRANLELEYAKDSLIIAKAKIDSSRDRVNASNKTYSAILEKFRAGVVDNIVYLDALSEKYDSIALLEMAKNDYEIKKANFYYYAGLNLEEYIK